MDTLVLSIYANGEEWVENTTICSSDDSVILWSVNKPLKINNTNPGKNYLKIFNIIFPYLQQTVISSPFFQSLFNIYGSHPGNSQDASTEFDNCLITKED